MDVPLLMDKEGDLLEEAQVVGRKDILVRVGEGLKCFLKLSLLEQAVDKRYTSHKHVVLS